MVEASIICMYYIHVQEAVTTALAGSITKEDKHL